MPAAGLVYFSPTVCILVISYFTFLVAFTAISIGVPWLVYLCTPKRFRPRLDYWWAADDFSKLLALTLIVLLAGPLALWLIGYPNSSIIGFVWELLKGLVSSLPFF